MGGFRDYANESSGLDLTTSEIAALHLFWEDLRHRIDLGDIYDPDISSMYILSAFRKMEQFCIENKIKKIPEKRPPKKGFFSRLFG